MNYVKASEVAPLVGAWIETSVGAGATATAPNVAPLVGAWIETHPFRLRPSRGCVAPLVGAWIETHVPNLSVFPLLGRTPRGCVD